MFRMSHSGKSQRWDGDILSATCDVMTDISLLQQISIQHAGDALYHSLQIVARETQQKQRCR